jgi:ketosteroid isomerase-like protein
MSDENVAVVRRMYAAFHGGDRDSALAHFHPEVVVDASRRVDSGRDRPGSRGPERDHRQLAGTLG